MGSVHVLRRCFWRHSEVVQQTIAEPAIMQVCLVSRMYPVGMRQAHRSRLGHSYWLVMCGPGGYHMFGL